MSINRRFLSQSLRILHSKRPNLSEVYVDLFEQQCFKSLRSQLPQHLDDLEPHQLSQSLNEIISKSGMSKKEASLIHNSLIQKLSKFEYGISTLHSKELQKIGESPNYNSIKEIIRNNPGRVLDSWELLFKYAPKLSDELLATALESIVSLNAVDKSEKRDFSTLAAAQCIILLDNISQKEVVKPELIEKLLIYALDNDLSYVLPSILSFGLSSLKVFESRYENVTPLQIFLLNKFCPFDLLKQSKSLLYKTIDILGRKATIEGNENELLHAEILIQDVSRLKLGIPSSWRVPDVVARPQDSSMAFLKLFDQIHTDKQDRNDFTVAQKLMRIFGTYRDNTKISLELYHSYLTSYPGFSHELMFETCLALAFQSYRTSNQTLLRYSEAFIPPDAHPSMLANIYCALILANSKFTVDESLEIYNNCIDQFSNENDPKTSISPQGMITESLILAYLSKAEIQFARVVFEGAVREGVIKGPTAIRRVKKLLSLYGDAIEKDELLNNMEQKVLSTLQTM